MSAGGIFTYSIGILRQLIKSPEIKKLVIITSNEVAERLKEFTNIDKVEIKTVDRIEFGTKFRLLIWYLIYSLLSLFQLIILFKPLIVLLKNVITVLNPYKKIISSNEIDILHVPVQYSPLYMTKVPVIITMHDLQEYHFPQYFSLRERIGRKIKNKMAINDSDHIIVSFNHVRNDIINFFKVKDGKVSVCPPPFAENWFLEKKETEWKETAKKYALKNKFLLYPAATWQHKNHLKLLEAFKSIRDEGLEYELICTGNKTEFYNKIIRLHIEQLELTGAVHFPGIVPEEDLISFYKNTSLVVIPTLYEAGSGPLYEAMRYRVPVICSNVTSLPDTMKNEEFLFNPNDVNEMTEKIKMILTDDNFRKRNIENSRDRMEYFKKIDYTQNFVNVYKKNNTITS